MKPNRAAETILSTTRATAKLHEFRVSQEDFIELPRDPATLFTLAVGLLGDVAAAVADQPIADPDLTSVSWIPKPDVWNDDDPTPASGLQFASTFFDAYLNARLDQNIDTEVSLLCSAAYYLSGNVGSASVVARRMDTPPIELCGGLAHLLCKVLRNDLSAIPIPHVHSSETAAVLISMSGYATFHNDMDGAYNALNQLRVASYRAGSPRELLYSDLIAAVCKRKLCNASRTLLPIASELSADVWRSALAKPHFPNELWPAQQRIAAAGLLRGTSAVIQMPTSAGKTRATELIIRSSFLSRRSTLAVIVAPYRSLCHDIRGDLSVAFSGEPIRLDEVSDSYQLDLSIADLATTQSVLIVTPEKLLYMLRRAPELARQIGLVIYDEAHQFDGMTRGPTYELLLTSLRMALAPTTQTVLISAVIGNAPALADWLLGNSEAVVSGSGLLPTAKSIAFASWQDLRGRLQYVSPRDPDEREFFVPRIISEVTLPRRGREINERKFPKKDGGDVGLFLGLHVVANGSVAIFCGRKDSAVKICRRAVDIFDRDAPFERPLNASNVQEIEKLRNLAEAHLGAGATATRAAAVGIFAHHADTPHGLRLSIEHAMKEGLAKFVICTSTLAQGVNFPLKYLIVTSTRQAGEKILVRDFHNLMGRAGRAGMHTEGSIIFSTPAVFDQRNDFRHSWRWLEAKELLDPNNSEPCSSSLLAIFDDYVQRQAPPVVQAVLPEWLDLAFADRDRIEAIVNEALILQPNISTNEFRRFIEVRAKAVQGVATFLISNMTFQDDENASERVIELAANTLAYNLANEDQRAKLIEFFLLVAQSISESTDDTQRVLIKKSPLPPHALAELQVWLAGNLSQLSQAIADNRLLGAVSDTLISYTSAPSIRKISVAGAVPLALSEWVNGRSYTVVHNLLERRDARFGRERISIEDTVSICENGFGYDIAMIVATLADLAENIDPSIYEAFALLQRQVKHGLCHKAALAFFEAGFADRVVASKLGQTWPLVTDRGGVRSVCRDERVAVQAVLESVPSYFKSVADELGSLG